MRFVERRFPVEMERLELLPLSDIHRGASTFDVDAWEKNRDWLLEAPNRFCCINGDAFENATKTSKGDVYRSLPPNEERKWLRRELAKIRDKILFMNEGNHDQRTTRDSDISPLEAIADELEVPYSYGGTFLKLAVGGLKGDKDKPAVYKVYAVHGWGGGRSAGAPMNQVTQLTAVVSADVYILSHHHRPSVSEDSYFEPNLYANTLEERPRLYVVSASLLGYAPYVEQHGMRPTSRRFPVVVFNGRRREVRYESGP